MPLARSTITAAAVLALGGCSTGGYQLPTTGHTSGSASNTVSSSTSAGQSTSGSTGSTTGGSTSVDSSSSSGSTGSSAGTAGSSTTSSSTTGAPLSGACTPGASGSQSLGGSCDANGAPGTCVSEGFYCLIDGDAGFCPSVGYVSGYPFAAVLDGGADGGPLGTSELFDLDAGQPIFNGICAPTPGNIPLGATCNGTGPNDPFGGCVAGSFCLGTCQAACDVRDPLSCGPVLSGKTCRSVQTTGPIGLPDAAAIMYPLGVCSGCLDANPYYGCAVASECCQSETPVICFGARTSPLLDGGFLYGTCAACTACENDPVGCPCVVSSDCCNSSDACIGGTCTPCIVSGAPGSEGFCTSSTDCCSPGPGGTACIANSCQAALDAGATCQIDDDCIYGLCDELALVCQ
jgi:hypothetical protein